MSACKESFQSLTDTSPVLSHALESSANEEGIRFLLLFGHTPSAYAILGLEKNLSYPTCIVQVSVKSGCFVMEDVAARDGLSLQITISSYLELFTFFESIWPDRLSRLLMKCKDIQANKDDWFYLSKHLSVMDPRGFEYSYRLSQDVTFVATALPKANGIDLNLKLVRADHALMIPLGAVTRLFSDKSAYQVVSQRYNKAMAEGISQ